MSGGGSSQSAPTNQTVTQTNIPKEFMPYFGRLMGRVEEQSLQGYQPYTGQRLATSGQFADIGASRDIVRDVAGAGVPGLDFAQQTAQQNVDLARGLGSYATGNFTPYSGFKAVSAAPYGNFSEAGFNEFQFDPAGQFTGSSVGQYMDPYLQNVVDVQKQEALRDFDINRGARNTRAVQAGAFGGSRQAVQEGMAERDLLTRMGDIQARGLSTAYGDAQRMFEADRAARLGVDASRAAENARVQAARAGELGRVQAAQAAELARTQGIDVSEAGRVQAAQAGELGRVQTAEEASRQFGAGQGLAALGAAGAEAGRLAALGEQERGAQIQGAQLLEGIGKAQQAEKQAGYDIAYQDFLRQQGYPQEQLAFYADILRGLPVAPTSAQTQQGYQSYNPLQQALGAGLTGLSLYKAFA